MFLAYLLQALLCVLPLWVLQMPIWFDIVYILVTSFAPVIPFYGDMIAGVLRAAVSQSVPSAFATARIVQSPTILPAGFGL